MRFEIEPKDFLAAIRFAKKAVPGRALIDVLTHVRITVADGSLSVEGSDLEVYARKTVTASVPDGGACCVNARTIEQIAASCRGLVSCELAGERLKLKSGLLESDLPTLPAKDFPGVDLKIEGETEVDVDLKPLAAFCGDESLHPFLAGVNMVGGKVASGMVGVFMWQDGVAGVAANIHARHTPLLFGRMFISERRWRCEGEGEVTSGLLLQDTLTESHVDRFFRDGGDHLFSVDADAWLAALNAVAIDEKTSGVLHSVKDGKMTISTQASIGVASDQIDVDGDVAFAVGFQVRLLRLVLAAAAGSVLEVSLDDGMYRMKAGVSNWVLVPYRMAGAT